MTPYEVMLSESQERMLIVAKRGREDEVLAHLPQVGPGRGGHRASHRRRAACGSSTAGRRSRTSPSTPLTDGAPVYDRPTQQALRAGRAAGIRSVVGPAAGGITARRCSRCSRGRRSRARSGSFGSTTTSCGWGRPCGPGRRRGGGARRADREGPRPGGRLQRAVRVPRPVRGRAAGGGGVRAERLLRGRRAARPDRLPELRQPRAAGDHVAVRRGDARHRRGLPRAGRPGGEREREPLQRDRGQGDPADSDRRRGGVASRRERDLRGRVPHGGAQDRGAR